MDLYRTTSRRNFLALAGLSGSAALLSNVSSMAPLFADEPHPTKTDGFQFSAEPMLQLPLGRSLAVRWVTSKPSKTWVEFGVSEELGQKAVSSRYGLIDLSSNKHEALLEALEPGGFQGLLRYLQEGEQHYEIGVKSMVQKDFRTAAEFFSVGNLPLLLQLKPLAHHYRHMAKYFTTPRLKSAFTFQDSYMGMSPFEAPATFSMMPYTELVHGIWYPIGGMYRIAEVLVDIAREAGVEFIFDAEVQRIEVADDRVTGVLCKNNRHYTADIVIANADLPYVYQALLPEDRSADELEHKSFSCSTISFFWGVDKVYDALGPHMLFLSDDYRENFESIIHGLTLPDNPCVYLHTPARLDRSAAPGGEDTLIAIVPVGHLDERSEQDWIDIRDRARKAVLRRLEHLALPGHPHHRDGAAGPQRLVGERVDVEQLHLALLCVSAAHGLGAVARVARRDRLGLERHRDRDGGRVVLLHREPAVESAARHRDAVTGKIDVSRETAL